MKQKFLAKDLDIYKKKILDLKLQIRYMHSNGGCSHKMTISKQPLKFYSAKRRQVFVRIWHEKWNAK